MEFQFRYYWPTRTAEVVDVRRADGTERSPQELREVLAGYCRVWHVRRDGEGIAVNTIEQLLVRPISTPHPFNRYTVTEIDAC